MSLALLGIRLGLAAVFLAAAQGKLRDRPGFVATLTGFGLAPGAARAAAVLIPALEVGVAALLLPAGSAWWGALASLALLALFTAAAALNLARGRRPECACFGSTSSGPIGAATFVRNGALAACALLIVVSGAGLGLSVDAAGERWQAASFDERVLLVLAVALLAALVATERGAQTLRAENAALAARSAGPTLPSRGRRDPALAVADASRAASEALPRGTPAPAFALPLLEGDQASLDTLTRPGLPLLLLFSDAQCPACMQLWPDVERWQRDYAAALTVAAICGGPSQLIEMKLMGFEVKNVLLRGEGSVSEAYPLQSTPAAVVVDAASRIDSEVAVGAPAIQRWWPS